MTTRKAKLVPWYHVNKFRCRIDTIAGNQCKNSASFMAESGMNGSSEKVPACKPHADILRLDRDKPWKIKPIRERFITI
jgi:hypothetical protein